MWNAAEWKCSVKCVLTDAEGAQHVLPHRSAAMLALCLCSCVIFCKRPLERFSRWRLGHPGQVSSSVYRLKLQTRRELSI